MYKVVPLFIYDEKDDNSLLAKLEEEVKGSGIKIKVIDSSKVAIACRTSERMKAVGVYLCKRKYSRGLDIKFRVDAHTLILAREKGIPWSEKVQMAGRGCRSQGVAQATYFTYVLDKDSPFEDSLKSLEFVVHEGAELLKLAYDRWGKLNAFQRAQVTKAFDNNGWMEKKLGFERKNPVVWLMLAVDGQRENSGSTEEKFKKQ